MAFYQAIVLFSPATAKAFKLYTHACSCKYLHFVEMIGISKMLQHQFVA